MNYIIKGMVPVLLAMVSLTSCLKDENPQTDLSQVPALVDFNAVKGTAALNISSTPTDFNVPVNYRSTDAASKDIVVTMSVDQVTLDKYNAANGTSLELLPAAIYTLNPKVTIPAGQRVVNLPIKISTSLIDPSKAYAIPLKMVSADGATVSGNFGTLVLAVAVKNMYDGKYAVTGTALRAGDPVLSGDFAVMEFSLLTTGANSVIMSKNAVWATGGGIGGIGPFEFTIDPVTNLVTVSDDVNPAVVNNPAGTNSYDPATKTLTVSVYWGNGPLHRAWRAKFVKK
ncbi:MAG: DUF1735 domain-containing protein [Pyrinomonadaceae bacterium]|nr:DUF1735 domain-containing protein [Sphingobacteriaceae bacterium]